jgi:hypothetical protein
MAKKDYPVKQASAPVVKESKVIYEKNRLNKDAARQYYTVDEFAEKFRLAINDTYGYELIKENEW